MRSEPGSNHQSGTSSVFVVDWMNFLHLFVCAPVVGQPEHSQTSTEDSQCLNGKYHFAVPRELLPIFFFSILCLSNAFFLLLLQMCSSSRSHGSHLTHALNILTGAMQRIRVTNLARWLRREGYLAPRGRKLYCLLLQVIAVSSETFGYAFMFEHSPTSAAVDWQRVGDKLKQAVESFAYFQERFSEKLLCLL